jgi:hypothetical protein
MPQNEELSIVIHFLHLRSVAHISLRIPWADRLTIARLEQVAAVLQSDMALLS